MKNSVNWSSATTIGIDLGDRFSSYCALVVDGSIVAEDREWSV